MLGSAGGGAERLWGAWVETSSALLRGHLLTVLTTGSWSSAVALGVVLLGVMAHLLVILLGVVVLRVSIAHSLAMVLHVGVLRVSLVVVTVLALVILVSLHIFNFMILFRRS